MLRCASQGFCSIIGAHFITLFCGGVCVCVCVYLVQSPMLLTYVLHRDLLFGFTVAFCAICNALLYASTSVNAPPCFKYIAVWSTSHICMSGFILLWHQSCEDAAAAAFLLHLPQMLLWPRWTKQVFSLIIWTTSGHKAERRWRRTFVLEGGRP